MKILIIAILLFSSFVVSAQNITKDELTKEIKPLNEKLSSLQIENAKLKKEVGTLSSKLSRTTTKHDSLQKQTEANSSIINRTIEELGSKISTAETNSNLKISEFDQSLSNKSLYGIIGVLLAILFSAFIYWLLSRRQITDKSDLINQLSSTKSFIEESLVKEFGKQTELMETHLHLMEQQKSNIRETSNVEPNHSLALKLASEINLIERNVKLMDNKTKGLKQLVASIGKLRDNLAANGYDMPELLGKQFHQGMKVIVASSISDDNLEKDSEIITKILIPQVNFNDKMIQTAQIETSKGF